MDHVENGSRRQRFGRLIMLSALLVTSCVDPAFVQSVAQERHFFAFVQEGEVTVRDGEEVLVHYQTLFQSPPSLTIVELRQSYSKKKPFGKGDFSFVQQDRAFFKIANNHPEQNLGGWATVKWRAEGVRGDEQSASKTKQEQIISNIKRAGGTLSVDSRLPDKPIITIDLHRTRFSDADLEQLKGLTSLRSLNLYGTKITDAGLAHLSGLSSLQTLHLNYTSIGDNGLQSLCGLTNLRELGLYHTHVTDYGLVHLKGLANLQDLALSGTQITDQGLVNLKGLRNLRRLLLTQTSVTPEGIRELQRVLPQVRIVH
jgi:hypothetical protein